MHEIESELNFQLFDFLEPDLGSNFSILNLVLISVHILIVISKGIKGLFGWANLAREVQIL